MAEPPVPVHVSVYVAFVASAPVDCDPDVACVPDHEPLAVHDVALVLDQVSVEELPEAMLAGEALRVTVGAGAAATDTVADPFAEPPVPVQVSVYVALVVRAPVVAVPDVAFAPDQAPLAVHDVALVLDQVSVDEAPEAMLAGEALIVAVGADVIATVAD